MTHRVTVSEGLSGQVPGKLGGFSSVLPPHETLWKRCLCYNGFNIVDLTVTDVDHVCEFYSGLQKTTTWSSIKMISKQIGDEGVSKYDPRTNTKPRGICTKSE